MGKGGQHEKEWHKGFDDFLFALRLFLIDGFERDRSPLTARQASFGCDLRPHASTTPVSLIKSICCLSILCSHGWLFSDPNMNDWAVHYQQRSLRRMLLWKSAEMVQNYRELLGSSYHTKPSPDLRLRPLPSKTFEKFRPCGKRTNTTHKSMVQCLGYPIFGRKCEASPGPLFQCRACESVTGFTKLGMSTREAARCAALIVDGAWRKTSRLGWNL